VQGRPIPGGLFLYYFYTHMISLLHCHISHLPAGVLETRSARLPPFMRSEIGRYKTEPDRKSRLAARLMLYQALEEDGKPGLIHGWKRDAHHKPYIEGWSAFSISHSGDLAVFCCGSDPVGIDIEKNADQDYTQIASYFHPKEQVFIREAKDIRKAFYTIWTRKEAFSKAIGTGIAIGLNQFDCTGERIGLEGRIWHFYRVDIDKDYTCYLCTPHAESKIRIRELCLY
jgi:4'-phosphopantetheinyl transferase